MIPVTNNNQIIIRLWSEDDFSSIQSKLISDGIPKIHRNNMFSISHSDINITISIQSNFNNFYNNNQKYKSFKSFVICTISNTHLSFINNLDTIIDFIKFGKKITL